MTTTRTAGHLVRVDVAQLAIGPDHIPGLSWPRIWLWAALLATTRLEPTPIEIEPLDNAPDGWWRIRNGRHRYVAALIAGRPNILATQEAP